MPRAAFRDHVDRSRRRSEAPGLLAGQRAGPSAEILETLDRWGVHTCEALAALPVLYLSERLGQEGVQLHAVGARRERSRSMVLAEPGTCFEEEMELDDSVEELEPLAFLLGRLLINLCARLQARSLAFQRHSFAFRTGSFRQRRSANSKRASSRRRIKQISMKKLLTLPVPMRDSKMLLNLLRLQLQGDPPPAPILKISWPPSLPGRARCKRAVPSGLSRSRETGIDHCAAG